MDFKEATQRLKKSLTDQEIAEELSVSIQSVRQARAEPESASFRKPPDGWREALVALCERRQEELRRLEEELSQDEPDGED